MPPIKVLESSSNWTNYQKNAMGKVTKNELKSILRHDLSIIFWHFFFSRWSMDEDFCWSLDRHRFKHWEALVIILILTKGGFFQGKVGSNLN
jgi:hypothetical protein